ncbi:MAG: DUF2130 domain-containing protein [Candidatus Scalindua sp.]|nr:DUF2130 domain-containing protein [Candidatus Scalindua sp.]MDV5165177.1 DUF2130 domain-containing protein [Candidatus Scalindua sp.]
MTKETIKCPDCGAVIELSEAISHDIEVRLKQQYENEIGKTKKAIEEKAKKETQESLNIKISDLSEQLEEKTKNLKEAQRQELELRKRQRELEEKEEKLELELSRKIDAERQKIIQKTSMEFEETYRLKDAEKDKQLDDMKKQIDELKRKAEQGSQQMQGEVLELELEESLKEEFPFDEIEPVAKGIKGGDIIQTVKTQSGRICGKILWETKRTKNWSDSWIQKLKDDQRDAKADLAILASETLPKGFHHFRLISGVWVTDILSAVSLALALRVVLIQVARERETQVGKKEKMEIAYNYLTGQEFRNRVEAIVESFTAMKGDLEAERRAMLKIWAKREKQIERVITNAAGMHGDLQEIAGTSLPTIKMLELPNDDE